MCTRAPRVVLAVLAVLMTRQASATMDLVILEESVSNAYGARCLDGSPYGYFYEAGTQAKWVFFFEGGGVCYQQTDCEERATTALGSSTQFQSTLDDDLNVLSTSNSLNPDYFNWHHVFINYCSGDAHLGQRTSTGPTYWNLYFSGHWNVRALLDSLRNTTALVNATDILVSGSSAGGIGVNHYADFFSAAFPLARVVASPQAGWFDAPAVSYRNYTGQSSSASTLDLFELYDAWFDDSCRAANAGRGFHYCFSMTNLYPYITTPLMVAQNRFDEYQIFINQAAPGPLNVSSVPVVSYIQYFGQQQVAALQQMRGVAKDGLFMPNCLNHTDNIHLQSTTVDGLSYRQVLGDWHFQRNQVSHFVYDKCGSLPCNPQCLVIRPPAGSGLTTEGSDPFGSSASIRLGSSAISVICLCLWILGVWSI